MLTAAALLALAIWIHLLVGRGGFWRCRERDDAVARNVAIPASWPDVAVVIPARDEADMVGPCLGSLLGQNYAGRLSVFLVDDQSADGTGAIALETARASGAQDRLRVIHGSTLPPGWAGKPWAMRQGLAAVEALPEPPEYVLFTDADIRYDQGAVQRLVTIALARGTVLTTLMVKLRFASVAERWFVPAFVFFFQMLYPFAWVNDARRATAAAAGGCMLIRRAALARAGGLEALHGALIDDCAMGALLKRQGPVWLGLTEAVHSLRPYETFASFAQMVSRSAFAELRFSSLRLVGAVLGMVLTYLLPPALAIFGGGLPQLLGVAAWLLMAIGFAPILQLYGAPLYRGLALPGIAAAYVGFTLQSALHYWQGRGGYWKGRVQAPARRVKSS